MIVSAPVATTSGNYCSFFCFGELIHMYFAARAATQYYCSHVSSMIPPLHPVAPKGKESKGVGREGGGGGRRYNPRTRSKSCLLGVIFHIMQADYLSCRLF